MVDRDFLAQIGGFSLTTAEILYRMPDHPGLLQSFIWQDYDVHPRYPKLVGFLDYWRTNLDGQLYKVLVAHRQLVKPTELRMLDADYRLN